MAVSGRSFLAMLTHISGTPLEKTVSIHRHWKDAVSMLGPLIEAVPILLVVPVLLFLIGLLDKYFTAAFQLSVFSWAMLLVASMSALILGAVVAALAYAMLHSLKHPETSPFRTKISDFIISFVSFVFPKPIDSVRAEILQDYEVETYHSILLATHDDDLVEQAGAALFSLSSETRYMNTTRQDKLSPLDVKTLVHLLSPESSYRSNISAAETILKMDRALYRTDGINC